MPVSTTLPLRSLGTIFSIVALAFCVPARAASLQLTFGERSVAVSSSTPGGDVALFAIAKEASNSAVPVPMKTGHAVVLHDIDHDGTVIFERERPLPLMAIWVAVDLASGRWVVSGSLGFEPPTITLEPLAKRDSTGQLRKLSALVPEMDVLLVRAGAGSWRIYAAKTSGLDENAHGDQQLQIDVSNMIPLSGSPSKLDSILPGDVIVLIEPVSMRFTVQEVGR